MFRIGQERVITMLLLLMTLFIGTTLGQQNETEALICEGAQLAIYTTEYEFEQNPCNECSYDSNTGDLTMICRYEYCEECNTDIKMCGIKIITIIYNIDENNILSYKEGLKPLDIGDTHSYCIDYTQGDYAGRSDICVSITNTFIKNSNCGQSELPYGLPLLTCREGQECYCANPESDVDESSIFVGFETFTFQSCFNENATRVNSLDETTSGAGVVASTRSNWLIVAFLYSFGLIIFL